MHVEVKQVAQVTIKGVEGIADPIVVITENHKPGMGTIVVKVYDESWSSGWGAMSERSVEQFFIDAPTDYLVNCLSPGLRDEVEDWEASAKKLKRYIGHAGRVPDISFNEAELNDVNDRLSFDMVATQIIGDDWHCWFDLVFKPNHHYTYLEKIVEAIKVAFKQLQVPA